MRRGFSLFFLLLTYSAALAQYGTEPIRLTDMLKIKAINGVALSNDGKKIAYVVNAIIQDDKYPDEYNYQSQIWLANADGSGNRQITSAKEGASQPAWSPDGNTLAFVRAVDGTPQIFLLSMEGGEPLQLTTLKPGASGPVWSPDGKRIAFTASFSLRDYVNDTGANRSGRVPSFPLEKPGFTSNDFLLKSKRKGDPDGSIEEVRAWLARNEADKKAKVINRINFQQETTTSSEYSISHVYVTGSTPGSKTVAVTSGFKGFGNPSFINNDKLVVEANLDSTQLPDRSLSSSIWTVNVDGSSLQMLAGEKDKRYSGAAVSPDGKWIAYQKGATQFNTFPVLEILSLQPGAKPVQVVHDRNKQALTWSSDSRLLYYVTPSNGGLVLHKADPLTGKFTSLSSTDEGVGSYDVKNNRIAFVKTAVASPFELYVADANMKDQKVLTTLNSSWLKDKKLSFPQKYTFTNAAGLEVEYWVMKPVNFEAGRKYPMLLEIHGGPSAMWGPGESSMWHEFQYFCSKGYGVVYSNPRGSGGYTEKFLRANVNDWGAGPASDVLGSLDRAVQQGWADTSRLLITGGSYAGYLTAWIVGHDKRFAAACAQRGVYDLRTFFGEGNAWRLVPNYFGGYPWEKTTAEILERESPINYVQNITTPLIIFHGENDLRTGVIQSEQLYRSLKILGRPVEYVRHPGASHEITRSGNNRQRMDQMLRTWEFFERFLAR